MSRFSSKTLRTVAFSLCCFALPFSTPASAEEGKVLVTVNGEQITENIFRIYLGRRGGNSNTPEGQVAAMNELVNYVLLRQQAEKEGVTEQPEVQTSLKLLRDEHLSKILLAKHLREHPVTEEQATIKYNELYKDGAGKEYKARHILVETEDKAKELIAELSKGGDFAELAKTHSTGPSGPKGGDLGWFGTKQMVPEFSAAVQKLGKGEYSKEPVKTQFGWHVILVEDSRDAPIPPFEKLKSRLMQAKQQEVAAEYIKSLRDGGDIEVIQHDEEE